MYLNECPLRVKARFAGVDVAPQFLLRLQELGIRPGSEFVAVNRAAFGGVVVNVAGARVAVDRGAAKKMLVELAR